jgi:hypothetical protein
VHSTTRLEISSDIWRARYGTGLVCARSTFTTSMAQEDGHNDLLLGEEVASTTPHVSRRPTSRARASSSTTRCGAGLSAPIGARTEWAAHGSQGVAPQPPW